MEDDVRVAEMILKPVSESLERRGNGSEASELSRFGEISSEFKRKKRRLKPF